MKKSVYINKRRKALSIRELITKQVFEYDVDNRTNNMTILHHWAVSLDKYHNEVKALQRYFHDLDGTIPNEFGYNSESLSDLYFNLNYISDRFMSNERLQLLIDSPKLYTKLVNDFLGLRDLK